MADVFLSYSSRDRAAAQKVQEALSVRGIDVFWDQATPPGQDWDTWIRSKLANCKVAIVLWSRESVKSDNVRHEALVARKAKKLLPAMIDSIEAEDLPMGLYVVQATNMTDWRNPESAGLARLVAEVENRVGRRTPGAIQAAASQPPRKINWVGVAVGVAMVAAATGLTQWYYSPKTSPVSPGLASLPCANNLPRIADTGECPEIGASFDPTRVLTAPAASCLDGSTPTAGICDNGARPIPPAPALGGGGATLSTKIVGRWNWDGLACEEGPNVWMDEGHLVFTRPGNEFVHTIEADSVQQLTTRVIEPNSVAGQQYVLSPEYFATSDARSFNLVVENVTTGTRDVWSPC
jgi:hypothetical protein